MNIRLQKYKKNRLKGMNQYNAARAAGYSHNYSSQSSRIERIVKGSMEDALEQVGLTDSFMSKFMKKGLNAKKLYGKKGIKYADWGARHRFAETILKMAGKLKAEIEVKNDIKILPSIHITFTSQKVGEGGVRTDTEDGNLCAGEGVRSNRITQQV